MKAHSYLIIGLVLFSFSLAGCKPRQPEGSESRSASPPRHFRKTSGEPENFNRDIHVIRTLWTELSALDPSNEDEKEKYNLLLDALRKKIDALDPTLSDLPEFDQALIKEIRSHLDSEEDGDEEREL
jgi:hypothetical protein